MFEKHRLNKVPGYVNFNHKEETFHDLSEFSWDVQGQDIYIKFLPEVTEVMHNATTYALQMTMMTYGDKAKDLDTSLFRQSITVYLQHIHGLRDDYFNYANVNKTLNVQQKAFIKKAGCAP